MEKTVFDLLEQSIIKSNETKGRLALYKHYLQKKDYDMLTFISRLENYENAIEELKMEIGDHPPEERDVIENLVDFEIRNRLEDEDAGDLLVYVENEYETYKKISHLIPPNNHLLRELVSLLPSSKYMKAHPYINTIALKKSLENIPSRIEDVYVEADEEDASAFSRIEELCMNRIKTPSSSVFHFHRNKEGAIFKDRMLEILGGRDLSRIMLD